MVTVPTDVDRAAPVLAVHEIDIEAPLDTVWRLHTHVSAWPTWQTDITAAQLDGALELGVSFDWTSYGFSVTSTVYALPSDPASAGEERRAGSRACMNGSSARRRVACA